MAEKKLIVVVEGTSAMGPHWPIIVSGYLDKIIRSFCSGEFTCKKNSTSNVELSLVIFNAHGSHCACLVQRSGWTKDIEIFLRWLSEIPFSGDAFDGGAIAEGLSEALTMFPIASIENQTPQNVDVQRHCILVAASDPYPLPTPVYRPQIQNMEKSDAETVARSFSLCSVSLSVICPKQLSNLKEIYNVAKQNPQAADPPMENVRNSHFLVLISENFMEGCAALSLPGVVPSSTDSMPLSQQTSSPLQSAQSKYPKVWEGNLAGQRQGQTVFITRLEGYRTASASETLAAHWPATMKIVRLISQDHMKNKEYVGKADFLVFRALDRHVFLGHLQQKKLCAVIQLPSQTLLLTSSDKAYRLIGMLLPED